MEKQKVYKFQSPRNLQANTDAKLLYWSTLYFLRDKCDENNLVE